MPKKMNYTDGRGVSYTDSHWRLIRFTVDVESKFGSFTFAGYRDKAAFLAGKAKIDEKTYEVTGPAFDAYFFTYMTTPSLKIDTVAYQIATDMLVETGNMVEVGVDPLTEQPILAKEKAEFFGAATNEA